MITILDTDKPIGEVVSILKKYTRASVTPVMSSNQGRVWINLGNVPFGGLCWGDVYKKEGFILVND